MVETAKLQYRMPPELTIYTVKSFRKELVDKLDEDRDLLLYCQEVELVDGAGIQLLLSLEKTALNENFTVDFINPTPEFKEKVELAGITELLNFTEED